MRGVIALAALLAAIAGARAETGIASVYAGGLTANGEHASPSGLTAAHKSLPFNTLVRVTNDRTGRAIVVRINDRGPFVRGRIIDLMPAAARAIGFSGLAHVTLQILELGHARTFLHRHHRARRVARRHRRRVRLSSAERQ